MRGGEREKERGRDTGRGRSRLHAGGRCGTASWDSRIMPWAKGRCSTTKPLRHLAKCKFQLNYVLSAVLEQLNPELFRWSVWKSIPLVLWKGRERTVSSPYKLRKRILCIKVHYITFIKQSSPDSFHSKLSAMLSLLLHSTLLPCPGFSIHHDLFYVYFLLVS